MNKKIKGEWDDLEDFKRHVGHEKTDVIKLYYYRSSAYISIGSLNSEKIMGCNFADLYFSKKNNAIVIAFKNEKSDNSYKLSRTATGLIMINCRAFLEAIKFNSSIINRKQFDPVFENISGKGYCLIIYLDRDKNIL